MKGKMKAGVLHAINDVRCDEVDIPQIKDDEILIKVSCSGICGSDLERVFVTGTWTFPTTLGHEFGGVIVEMGKDVEGLKEGEKVVVNPMVPCGECHYCETGNFNLCDTYDYVGSRSDGGFGTYAKVKYTNAYKVPDNFTHEQIAGIDPAAIGLHVCARGGVTVNDNVVVFGAGPIGYYAIQWARVMGANKIIAVDLSKEKLDVAMKVGATHGINATEEKDVKAKIMELTDGYGADVCVEAAGSPITFNQAMQSARKQGKVACVGTPHADFEFQNDSYDKSLLRREVSVIGVWCYHFAAPLNEWQASIEAIAKGKILVEPLITHRYKVDDVDKAFKMIEDKKEFFNKILICQDDYEPGK